MCHFHAAGVAVFLPFGENIAGNVSMGLSMNDVYQLSVVVVVFDDVHLFSK